MVINEVQRKQRVTLPVLNITGAACKPQSGKIYLYRRRPMKNHDPKTKYSTTSY